MSTVPTFNTMGEMLDYWYGPQRVKKIDAPVISSTTGVYNPIFGAYAFSQVNNEANAFGLLPKYPFRRSGVRMITANPTSVDYGAVAENGEIPATIKPTFAEISIPTKEHAHSFDVSYRQEGYASMGDDAIGKMEFLRGFFAVYHAKDINRALLLDGNTLAGDKVESIDRVTASYAYATAVSWTAGDEDIYGIDRSGNSWADAVVSHNSGTDRTLTDEIIRDELAALEVKGAKTNILLTGPTTKYRIFGIYENQVRYQGVLKKDELVSLTLNGVSTETGIGVGMRVATLYGIPLFSSVDVVSDTIPRIYCLDTTNQDGTDYPRLGLRIMYPTLYFEAGMSASMPNPFIRSKFGTAGVYYTSLELVCTFLAVQGSIRDLK